MEKCVFCGIAKGKTTRVVVFPSIDPKSSLHLIIIPKRHVESLDQLDNGTFLEIRDRVMKLVREKKLDKNGYRLVTNGGTAKAVSHLHFHLLGGVSQERNV